MKATERKKEIVVKLPNGMTCYKEYEKEALRIYQNAYKKAFNGENYEYANAKADMALENYLKD
jgi:hypothetical protein